MRVADHSKTFDSRVKGADDFAQDVCAQPHAGEEDRCDQGRVSLCRVARPRTRAKQLDDSWPSEEEGYGVPKESGSESVFLPTTDV